MSSKNPRIDCPFCKSDHLIKSFSNHLLSYHKEQLFKDANKRELEWFSSRPPNRKDGVSYWFDPIELNYKDKTLYYVPCCEKFYTKKMMAHNAHVGKAECMKVAVSNAKELLNEINERFNITNTHSGSGNIINNITQNITVIDMSGNLTGLVKSLVVDMDVKESDRALLHKKNLKLKKLLEEHNIDFDSDVSDPLSEYDSDDSTKFNRFDPTRQIPKKYRDAFRDVDLSRAGLKLRTKEQHEDDLAAKAEEEKFKKEQEEFERSEALACAKGRIKDCKEKIKWCEGKIEMYVNDSETLWKNDINEFRNKIKKYQTVIEESEKEIRELSR